MRKMIAGACLSVLATFAGAGAAPGANDGDASFKDWVRQVATTQKFHICSWGRMGLVERSRARFAVLDPKTETSAFVLIERGRSLWLLPLKLESGESFDAPVTGLNCNEGTEEAPFANQETVDVTALGMAGLVATVSLSIDDQGPIQLGTNVIGRYEAFGEDLVKLVRSSSTMEFDEESGEALDESGQSQSLLLVRPPSAPGKPIPSARSRVTFGRKNHKGAKDASLTVKATALGDARPGVRLSIDVKDDVHVPLAASSSDAKDWLAADHLEIWLVPAGPEAQKSPSGSPLQLGIAFPPNTAPSVRWLHPADAAAPLPSVTGDAKHVDVDFPRETLGLTAEQWADGWRRPLTVAFSDNDGSGKRQETIVATSPLRWGKMETFGELVAFAGFRRFPQTEATSYGSRREAANAIAAANGGVATDEPCAPARRASERAEAARLQKAGKPGDAIATIERLIAACETKSDRWDVAWLRSDLALLRHGGGDDPGCTEALRKIPAGADMPARLHRAVGFNQGLCGATCADADAACLAGRTARSKR